jgi:hypothetical protein
MDDRQYRLRRCIQLGGEYFLELKKKFKKYLMFGNFTLTARTSGPPYTIDLAWQADHSRDSTA